MSDHRIAVLAIHGMGSQGDTPPQPDELSFSAGLQRKLRRHMGADLFDAKVSWHEIRWSDILQGRQERYLQEALAGRARWMFARRFVMHRLTDAAAYRWTTSPSDDIYEQIHDRVFQAVEHVESHAGGDVPLVVVAHSLGGHIMSNYIWDIQANRPARAPASAFQRLETLCSLVTFGCNIPIFTFALPEEEIYPIAYPGTAIPEGKRLAPWWLNYTDKDDVLGMPLAPICDRYAQMVRDGALEEHWVNTGNLFTSWTPLSHNGYWTDRDFYRPLAVQLRKAMRIGPL